MAPHNDHLHALVPGFPIALLSLGATRRLTIRAKQLHYLHGVPKTTAAVGERISLAFRVRPAHDPEEPSGFHG